MFAIADTTFDSFTNICAVAWKTARWDEDNTNVVTAVNTGTARRIHFRRRHTDK
jgi:hypothetical protein